MSLSSMNGRSARRTPAIDQLRSGPRQSLPGPRHTLPHCSATAPRPRRLATPHHDHVRVPLSSHPVRPVAIRVLQRVQRHWMTGRGPGPASARPTQRPTETGRCPLVAACKSERVQSGSPHSERRWRGVAWQCQDLTQPYRMDS